MSHHTPDSAHRQYLPPAMRGTAQATRLPRATTLVVCYILTVTKFLPYDNEPIY